MGLFICGIGFCSFRRLWESCKCFLNFFLKACISFWLLLMSPCVISWITCTSVWAACASFVRGLSWQYLDKCVGFHCSVDTHTQTLCPCTHTHTRTRTVSDPFDPFRSRSVWKDRQLQIESYVLFPQSLHKSNWKQLITQKNYNLWFHLRSDVVICLNYTYSVAPWLCALVLDLFLYTFHIFT